MDVMYQTWFSQKMDDPMVLLTHMFIWKDMY